MFFKLDECRRFDGYYHNLNMPVLTIKDIPFGYYGPVEVPITERVKIDDRWDILDSTGANMGLVIRKKLPKEIVAYLHNGGVHIQAGCDLYIPL